jgi:hypothetical protein
VKALEAAEASSQLALEATQLGYKVGVRVNVDVLERAEPAVPDAARPRARRATTCCMRDLRLRRPPAADARATCSRSHAARQKQHAARRLAP